jgi:hypothetical protein
MANTRFLVPDQAARPCGIDMLADAVEIRDQARKATAEVGVGNLREAELGHVVILAGPSDGTMTSQHPVANRKRVLRHASVEATSASADIRMPRPPSGESLNREVTPSRSSWPDAGLDHRRFGKDAVDRSGKPFRQSTTAIRMSATPRFHEIMTAWRPIAREPEVSPSLHSPSPSC